MVHGRPYNEALECFRQSRQTDYKGHLNMTVAGIPCQRWDSQNPHVHSQTDISKFPDDNFADAANYCRNPNGKIGLWCYTIDPDVEWQYCPLRHCDHMCMQDDKGSTYKGAIIRTSSGASCVSWSGPSIPFKQKSHFSSFWQGMIYCRNPLLSQSRPWCYTNAVNTSQYGLCDVPASCPTTSEMTRSRWVADVDQTFDDLLPSTECLVWNRLYTTDGNFSATWNDAFKPVLYRNTFTAQAICHKGRVFNTYLQCFNITESGTVWKAGVLECVHCGSAPSVENATVTISSSLLNGTATYACVTGYGHDSRSNRITCMKTGEWEVPDIICEVDCGTPPTLDHADVDVNSTLVGNTANYTCHDGYEHLSVSNEVTCLDTGNWDVADMKCEVNCGDPPSLNRTEVSFTDGFVNETAEYTCKPGYAHLSGSSVITCLDTGTWEDLGIYCEVDCGTPPTVDHADVDVNSTLVGQSANYTCHDGYAHISVSNEVTCLDTGNWDVADMKCEVDCSSPPVVANTVVISDNTTLNSTAVYTCSPGFVHVSGSTNITCLDTGFWEIPFIECVADCGLPPQITNTIMTYNSTLVNSTAEYTCVDGTAHASDSTQVTCQSDGNWTNSDTSCLVNCGSPPSVLNATVTISGTWVNSSAQYACHDGFTASGSASVICQLNGTWEVPSFMCKEVQLPSTTSSSTSTQIPVDKYGRTRTEKCICRCINPVPRKQEDIVAEISKNLTLETKTLTSYIIKKESLPDERKSSHGIAYVAIALIGALFGVVFLSDIYFFIHGIITHFWPRRSH
ncbi:sushi, von Willebrand factor type A, EGF and pentraxin domain-containing protein 1-like [Haliotis rubra]|uniref:sushi, von Willebrand factor type A, EGF and pentraxin domain-containing protein 1-like n=1 Tax=Haliotis rubra TaxID=36100 RepID=UPI001EE52E48|nr:sushi, von Willebrand factor type A, EGF and pentraxin domain-containing protein 1-like [Haliotis rubra]